jgi:maleate cis-trans isomerase
MPTLYAARALSGILTPQANTTVEPEMALLMPPGHGTITARLTSGCAAMNDRLIDYFNTIESTAAEFANAPVQALGFACTGASYLVGPQAEADLASRFAARGLPLVTAGQAIRSALATLGATRIAVASPYGDGLTDAALAYWQAQGLTVTQVVRIAENAAAFHPIYAHGADHALTAARALQNDPQAQAVVLLGTGLPTLPALAALAEARLPVLSSNLCLAWALDHAATGTAPDAATLHSWRKGSHWQAALAQRLPALP